MQDRCINEEGNSWHQVPGLSGIAPDMKLEPMRADLCQISSLIESKLFFLVKSAMIVGEE